MNQHTYSRTNPFYASIKERYSLCLPGSKKNTQHIVLDLKGSGIQYTIGDSIAIYPEHHPELVERTIQAMKAAGNERILDRQGKLVVLRHFLTKQASITEGNRQLLQALYGRQNDPIKKGKLENLLADEQHSALKEYLEKLQLCDILQEHEEVVLPLQELCLMLQPLLPRFYSIASSQHAVDHEVHLTVSQLKYDTNGYERVGVCTHYLCQLAPMEEPVVPIYVQPHRGFTLPADPKTPVIMIGPGTGVAPFRAFMQERQLKNAPGKNWLFFGEWNRATDFFYEEFWNSMTRTGKLKLDVAFSRDQAHKVYVQHRMLENGPEFYRWLEEGAYLYVCGDAKRMAKDVEATLLQIIQQHGPHDESRAKQYLKRLRTEKRYLRDVY